MNTLNKSPLIYFCVQIKFSVFRCSCSNAFLRFLFWIYVGYYADPEAQCQAFHICSAGLEGALAKYTFLCPNGTIFNQEYFICDWWFNVDCSEAEALAAERNSAIASEREAADARLAEENAAADDATVIDSYEASDEEAPQSSYGILDEAASENLPSYADQSSYSGRRRRF